MDLENKPNMKRMRIGGGYMMVRYASGGGIWQRWWYMVAVVVYGYVLVVVYGYGLVMVYGYGSVADKRWW